MLIHLKASKGGGWSEKYLNRAVCQVISTPLAGDAIIHNLHHLVSAAEIIFGSDSLLTVGLHSWRNVISYSLSIYESQATIDPTFISKVLTIIDTHVNCWLTK